MYYLTITKQSVDVVRRQPFADYAEAIAATSKFYRPRAGRSVLTFTTDVINGKFARSYAILNQPEDIAKSEFFYREMRDQAAKMTVAFNYDGSYFFSIESDFGITDSAAEEAEADAE